GRSGAFNALKVAFRATEAKLSDRHRRSAGERLWNMAAEIQAGLARLPITAERAEGFTSRLRSNLAHRLSPRERRVPRSSHTSHAVPWERRLPACCHASRAVSMPACGCTTPISFSDRLRGALATARAILNARRGEQARSFVRGLEAPFVFMSVVAV